MNVDMGRIWGWIWEGDLVPGFGQSELRMVSLDPIVRKQTQESFHFHPHGPHPHGGPVPLRPLSRCIAFFAFRLSEVSISYQISRLAPAAFQSWAARLSSVLFISELRTATDAVATISRGQIWDPLQPPPVVTRSRDPPLTHPRSSSLRTIRYRPLAQPPIDLLHANYLKC